MKLSTEERRMVALNQAAAKFDLDEDAGLLSNSKNGKVYDTPTSTGQIIVWTQARPLTAQQVIWYLTTGTDPNEHGARVIHMDGNPENNKPGNLRRYVGPLLGRAGYENNSSSPFAGVIFQKGRYYAQYGLNGEIKRVPGGYDTAVEAKVAREETLKTIMDDLIGDFPTTIEEAKK